MRAAEPREGGGMKGRAGRRVARASRTPALGAALRGGGRFPPGENARPAPGAPASGAAAKPPEAVLEGGHRLWR